jgi:hypothetical protein
MTRIAALVCAAMLSCPGTVPAASAMGPRAQCRKLCGDALAHCHEADDHRRCRRQIRAECRRDGPQIVCRPNYTGSWAFTPTGELMDGCDLAAGGDLAELPRMVVHADRWGDGICAEFGAARATLVGYVRTGGGTILEGEALLDGCVLGTEIFIEPSPLLPRNAVSGGIRAQGTCGDRGCLFEVDGRWDWRRE